MRVLLTGAGQFVDFLMLLGDGSPPAIEQSDVICLFFLGGTSVKSVDEFIQFASSDCRTNYQDTMALGKSNISSPQLTVTDINVKISLIVPV